MNIPAQIKKLNCKRGLSLIFFVGFIGHLIEPIRLRLIQLSPYVLLLAGIIVLHPFVQRPSLRFWGWIIGVTVGTFFIEVLGVQTGMVFGAYRYGDVLGTKWLGVPPIIGLNWALVVLGAIGVSQRSNHRHFCKTGTTQLPGARSRRGISRAAPAKLFDPSVSIDLHVSMSRCLTPVFTSVRSRRSTSREK